MKLTRRHVRKIIMEAISKSTGGLSVIGLPDSTHPSNSQAVKIEDTSRDKIVKALGVTSTSGKGAHYVWSKNVNPYFKDPASDTQKLEIESEPSKRVIYSVGAVTSGTGDPFTFDKVSDGRYRVISGPVAKSIGKIYKVPDSEIQKTPDMPETRDEKLLTRSTDMDLAGSTFVGRDRQKLALFVNELSGYAGGKFRGNSKLQDIYMDFANARDPNLHHRDGRRVRADDLSNIPTELSDLLDGSFKQVFELVSGSFMDKRTLSRLEFQETLAQAGFPAEINDDFRMLLQQVGLVAKDTQDTPAVARTLEEGSKQITRSQLRKIISAVTLKNG